MNKELQTLANVGIAVLFITTGIYASTEYVDVVRLENKAYAKHKDAIVIFEHRKHAEEYQEKNPELYNSPCGECHHVKVNDKESKPLLNLKEGDEVENCIECHKKPEFIKGRKAKGLSKQQRRDYHGNAMHDNCKDCHKKYNKKKKQKSKDKGYAPNTCKSCHAKNKK